MRAILDTNVLLSGLISPEGTPGLILRAWFNERFTLVAHALLVHELRTVTRRDGIRGKIRPAEAGRLVNQIALSAAMPGKLPTVERSRDPYDDFLLALCEAGCADWLITGDKKDLLALKRHGPTRIGTPAELAKILKL